MVSVAVAVPCWDVCAPALVDGSGAVAYTAGIECPDAVVDVIADAIAVGICRAIATTDVECVELVSVAVAVPCWDVRTPAFVDGAGSVADTTGIERPDAVVDIIADAIAVGICRAIATADAEGIVGQARFVFFCRGGIEIAGSTVGAPQDFIVIADAVIIGVVVDHKASAVCLSRTCVAPCGIRAGSV